jgi:hypothetical protein
MNRGQVNWTRGVKGAFPGATGFSLLWDRIDVVDYNGPAAAYLGGLRVASAIPTPSGVVVVLSMAFFQRPRRRRIWR